ncbi:2-amino-4-oxopentanoate thiolase subunit OrtA [Vagococcus salmoninarum]|uniref:2-amino-4-oxopentanoate thiolase subunit OrtA n=1 Tax=Vagococcus salmoninarum TaxID=2739 RepID=UPI003F945BEA
MTMQIEIGSYVQIHWIELQPEERTGKIPQDTKEVPLECWLKGFLTEVGQVGETVTIETVTNRLVKGTLVEVNPTYNYGFGHTYLPELLEVGLSLRKIMRGID